MFSSEKKSVEHRQVTIQLRYALWAQFIFAVVLLVGYSVAVTNVANAATHPQTALTAQQSPTTTTAVPKP